MKIYLAGPMRGLPGFNFPEFHKYAALLRSRGHEVFSPAEVRIPQDNMRAIFATEMDWICREAEAIALMPGWMQSKGARAEAALAIALDLKVMGVPGYQPTQGLGRLSPSELVCSTTSRALSQKSQKFPSSGKSSMEPPAGTARKVLMKLMLSFGISCSVALLTAMVCYTLQRWPGGH